ncbi:hypothetical protein U27_02982 [Candidatus Vecturithrix granuli]|uniref:Adenosyl-chloride synthase n=1 Tax=Vecturithrix granuli TaxID=1499967 RepID=A0A081BUL5_VECG1|nr:hypothetical protein U27_02982 [Candidatus Vecturithrix granuli]
MAEKRPIITLLTDFGLSDYFVAAMKGVILNINRGVELVDISHAVPPQDVLHAAFLLKSVYAYFPSDTIHVVVVDPSIGTQRRAILASSEKGFFIAPDNGVLSGIYEEVGVGEIREITADHYFLKPRTGTFDGRDVFAPVAAWLSKGVSLSSFGDFISDYKKLDFPAPLPIQEGVLKCKILSVDHFGNLISNLGCEQFKEYLDASEKRRFAFRVGEHTVSKLLQAYAEGEPDEVFAILGSSGLVEFSVKGGSAAALTRVGIGSDVLFKVI